MNKKVDTIILEREYKEEIPEFDDDLSIFNKIYDNDGYWKGGYHVQPKFLDE